MHHGVKSQYVDIILDNSNFVIIKVHYMHVIVHNFFYSDFEVAVNWEVLKYFLISEDSFSHW